MPRQVLIVDDEPLARDRLRRLLERIPDHQVCAEAGDAGGVLQAIAEHNPDIVLLDIRMPGEDGLSIAHRLATLDNPPAIIFCTAYDKYAIEAFSCQAVAYLLKPVRHEALADALNRAGRINRVQLEALRQQQPATTPATLLARTLRGQELIDLSQVVYCIADQKYVTLIQREGQILTDLTLKELEIAHPRQLLRIHRHTLVNTRHIAGLIRDHLGQYRLGLRDRPEQLEISRRHLTLVRAWLNAHNEPGRL